MYERTFWLDHVEDQGGEVIQEGTPLDQAHFNKMEVGIEDANLAHKIVMIFARWIERRLAAIEGTSETHTTDIAGIKAKDNDDKNVILTTVRKNTNYTVDVYVKSVADGRLGDITVSGKGTNSFKVRHDGSAKTVVLTLKITGGMK